MVGVGIAALTRPASLLDGAQNRPPRLKDVWRQLYLAKLVDTDAGWLAVGEYFPDASNYCRGLAKQGLAYWYLGKHQYEKAIEPLKELAAQSDFKAFGVAGLVVAYANLGDDEKANVANGQLSIEMRESLRKQSPQMSELLNKTLDEVFDRAI
jgi:hypothetical protein